MAISVEQALEYILLSAPILAEEEAPLLDCTGRTLAQDVFSPIAQPPFDRSPLDGYAVIASDIAKASRTDPVKLRVVDKLYAGDNSAVPVLPGQAVRLMTGSMIPSGADCIIRQEDTDEGELTVQIFKAVEAGSNYCRRGEEYGPHDRLLTAGQKIDAASIAVAAGAGLSCLPVRRRVRAAVIATGDEIRQPGQPLPPGKIYDSNTSYLVARLGQLGVDIVSTASAGDDLEQIAASLQKAEADADLILTTGGVSVGQKDLLEEAIWSFGGKVIFHGIAMKPGMPTLFAVKNQTVLLGLSGNPFSAAVPFELFLRPLLAHMTQDPTLVPQRGRACAANGFPKQSPSRRFLRALCRNGTVSIPQKQANGQMRSMIGCNCLIDIPAGTREIRRGDPVDIIWL